MSIALCLIIVSAIFSLVINCSESPKYPINKNIMGVLCSVTAVFTALGWIIYAAKIPSNLRTHLHACFGLAIISTILSTVNAVLSFTSPPLKPATSAVAVIAAPVISGYPITSGAVVVQSTQGIVHQDNTKQQPMMVQPPPYQQQTQPYYATGGMNPQGMVNPYPNQQYPPAQPLYPNQQYQQPNPQPQQQFPPPQ